MSAPNPALDAARLDVVPGLLWGRAEAVRSFVRAVLEAAAPLLFGIVSAALGGTSGGLGHGVDSAKQAVSPHVAAGIAHAFLVMLVPLALSGVLLLRGRRAYLRDIATATASDRVPTLSP